MATITMNPTNRGPTVNLDDNPFERWDLDPAADQETLTRKMRQLTRTVDPDDREQLQDDWRTLTADPVARARWALLTPPRASEMRSPWEVAETLSSSRKPPSGTLTPLRPTMEDALVLPRMDDEEVYEKPPFLPELLRDARRAPLDRDISDDRNPDGEAT